MPVCVCVLDPRQRGAREAAGPECGCAASLPGLPEENAGREGEAHAAAAPRQRTAPREPGDAAEPSRCLVPLPARGTSSLLEIQSSRVHVGIPLVVLLPLQLIIPASSLPSLNLSPYLITPSWLRRGLAHRAGAMFIRSPWVEEGLNRVGFFILPFVIFIYIILFFSHSSPVFLTSHSSSITFNSTRTIGNEWEH